MDAARIAAHRASIERDLDHLARVWPDLADELDAVVAALASWPDGLDAVEAALTALHAAAHQTDDAAPKSIADRLLEKLSAFRAEFEGGSAGE